MIFGQLTKYLRDYLEGKKEMSLILTVKSGEEDYRDTSHLLRQASPYMEIKFNNAEDPSNIPNKRQIQSLSRTEQRKRMKLTGSESCVVCLVFELFTYLYHVITSLCHNLTGSFRLFLFHYASLND
ncbi:kinesin-like protein KIN-6 [Rosa rugosa]|uniref:kinesin-like protein KIN-6 n=1 Tax=Rosa rugosa TaxID=74645 RepID=UPI002B412BA0|nr:kinesin-like protein KIN-6 [Rosa rugosa]XP_062024063.1 kinesin-like protein KIN-6 [Rosa rugosa]